MNEYIFLDDSGNVVSTLKTNGTFVETDKIIKVSGHAGYAGKKIANGKFEKVKPDAKIKTSGLTTDEKIDLILEKMGFDTK